MTKLIFANEEVPVEVHHSHILWVFDEELLDSSESQSSWDGKFKDHNLTFEGEVLRITHITPTWRAILWTPVIGDMAAWFVWDMPIYGFLGEGKVSDVNSNRLNKLLVLALFEYSNK